MPSIDDQSAPFAAFFITYFTGRENAHVYPSRTSAISIQQHMADLDLQYARIFQLGSHLLSDEAIDALMNRTEFAGGSLP
jgi:hypothetical protein